MQYFFLLCRIFFTLPHNTSNDIFVISTIRKVAQKICSSRYTLNCTRCVYRTYYMEAHKRRYGYYVQWKASKTAISTQTEKPRRAENFPTDVKHSLSRNDRHTFPHYLSSSPGVHTFRFPMLVFFPFFIIYICAEI